MTIYTENPDPCGFGNNAEHGTPPTGSPDYAYYVFYDGYNFSDSCAGREYEFLFKAGSITNPPLEYGYMGRSSGPAEINTEIYPTHDVVIGTDRYGCDPNLVCNNASFGIHLYDGSWHSFTTSYSATPLNGNPPWLHSYTNYWTFATCPVNC
ncbi:MAG TPA: hypothetical protein VE640_09135 [Candidatus Bathyarchaeia archaeon]|nr:hypothetical protein [Candidatus Bathyarchaeia archaeon]